MIENYNTFEEFAERDRQKLLITEVLDKTTRLFDHDPRTQGMTYAESLEQAVEPNHDLEVAQRVTRSAVENMMLMVPISSHEIDTEKSSYRTLVRRDQETGLSETYCLGEIRTKDGVTSRWMALALSDNSVQRALGVILAGNDLVFSSDELKSAPDDVSRTAYRLTQERLRPFLIPILNGRLLPGQELPKTLAVIRSDIEESGQVEDVDNFMCMLSDRYFKMSEARDFRESLGMDSSEMSTHSMKALSDFLDGNTRAIGLYTD